MNTFEEELKKLFDDYMGGEWNGNMFADVLAAHQAEMDRVALENTLASLIVEADLSFCLAEMRDWLSRRTY